VVRVETEAVVRVHGGGVVVTGLDNENRWLGGEDNE